MLCGAAQSVYAVGDKVFKTKYTTIYYSAERDLSDFVWRIGGSRFELLADSEIASNRIDRIVERVEAILDMYPKNFMVKMHLKRGELEQNSVAFYGRRSKSIQVNVDRVTDGVMAHEVAHAVINQYFASPPPSKIQEILTQYVDKYLWSDY